MEHRYIIPASGHTGAPPLGFPGRCGVIGDPLWFPVVCPRNILTIISIINIIIIIIIIVIIIIVIITKLIYYINLLHALC